MLPGPDSAHVTGRGRIPLGAPCQSADVHRTIFRKAEPPAGHEESACSATASSMSRLKAALAYTALGTTTNIDGP